MMLMVVRMMILNVVRYFSEKRTAMIMNSVVFEDDDGNNCHGMEWQQLPWHGMATIAMAAVELLNSSLQSAGFVNLN